MRGWAPQANFFAFFVAILYILSQLGKKYAYFYLLGEKYAWGGGVKQKNIHPWGNIISNYLNLKSIKNKKTKFVYYVISSNLQSPIDPNSCMVCSASFVALVFVVLACLLVLATVILFRLSILLDAAVVVESSLCRSSEIPEIK